MPMSNQELLTVLKSQLGDSIKYANDTFKTYNEDLDDAYNRRPYAQYPQEENRSGVIATDVYDTVESDMPSLARVFLGANKVMEFTPNTNKKDEIEEARQKTKYADYLIRGQKNSFKILHDLIKEPGKAMCSVAYYYQEEIEKPRYVNYTGISEEERDQFEAVLDDKNDRVEVILDEEEDGKHNVRFVAITKTKKMQIMPVPLESFIMTRGAISKDSAMLVGHETKKTKGKLIAEGYDKEMIRKLPVSVDAKGETTRQKRFENQGGWDYKSGYHWTNDEVVVQTLFPLVDFDEDGIPERRMVVKIGEEILENDPFGHVPYAIFSQILEPHSAIGKSRGEIASQKQLEKTALKRALMDNSFEVGRPRFAVDDSDGTMDGGKVDLDDLLNHEIAGVVRVDGVPQNAMMPLEVPYIGDKTLQVIQYLDSEKSVSLGNTLANQGLDADKLYKETATRFEGVQDEQAAKIELVARAYAETGFRELYEGVIWLAQHYQDEIAEFMALGEEFVVNPSDWQFEHYCESKVGLGAGDSEQMIQNLSGIAVMQQQLIAEQSPLADWQKLYNTMDDLTRLMGKPDVSKYFNNPEVPEETLFAENIALTRMVQELQAQGGGLQEMLARTEFLNAQAKLENSQINKEEAKLKIAEFTVDRQEGQQKFALEVEKLRNENEKLQKDIALAAAQINRLSSQASRDDAETEAQQLETELVRRGVVDLSAQTPTGN